VKLSRVGHFHALELILERLRVERHVADDHGDVFLRLVEETRPGGGIGVFHDRRLAGHSELAFSLSFGGDGPRRHGRDSGGEDETCEKHTNSCLHGPSYGNENPVP